MNKLVLYCKLLLPTGSEEREVLGVGTRAYSCCNTSLLSRYENCCIIMQRNQYSSVVNIRNNLETVLRHTIHPLAIKLTAARSFRTVVFTELIGLTDPMTLKQLSKFILLAFKDRMLPS